MNKIKRSITLKLFIILVLLLMAFTLAAVHLQALYFTSYYQDHLDTSLQENMRNFARDYTYAESKDAKDNLLNSFIQGNVAMAAIVDSAGQLRYTYDFSMTMRTHDGRMINIPIEDLGTLRELLSLDVTLNNELYVEGIFNKKTNKLTYLTCMAKNGKKAFVDSNNDEKLSGIYPDATSDPGTTDNQMIHMAFKGTVVAKNFPGPNVVGLTARKDALSEALRRIDPALYRSALLRSDFEDITYTSLLAPGTFRVFIYPLSRDSGGEFLIAMTPRKPIDEISSMMVPFYKIVTCSSVLASVLVAILFSVSITKPLVKLNQAATKLSRLEFDTDVVIPSSDELGSLSRSLSSLAQNLQTHMQALTITNEQLQNELDKERDLDKMRREFVSSVSHELKTPLAIIRGYTEGIQDGLNPNKTPHYLNVILGEIQRMDAMVMDMLQLAKLESMGTTKEHESFRLDTLIEEQMTQFALQIEHKHLTCQLDLEEGPLYAAGEKSAIDQVFKNFLSNAIRHAHERGNLSIRIESISIPSTERSDHAHFLVEIYNDGLPIPEEKLFRVWERFYRIEEDRGRESGGTGLGLSIVRTILERHGSLYGIENKSLGVAAHFTLKKA